MTEKILSCITQILILKRSAVAYGKCKQMDYGLICVLVMLLDLKDEGESLTHIWWEKVSHA